MRSSRELLLLAVASTQSFRCVGERPLQLPATEAFPTGAMLRSNNKAIPVVPAVLLLIAGLTLLLLLDIAPRAPAPPDLQAIDARTGEQTTLRLSAGDGMYAFLSASCLDCLRTATAVAPMLLQFDSAPTIVATTAQEAEFFGGIAATRSSRIRVVYAPQAKLVAAGIHDFPTFIQVREGYTSIRWLNFPSPGQLLASRFPPYAALMRLRLGVALR